MATSMFCKRHYEAIAAILNEALKRERYVEERSTVGDGENIVMHIREDLADLFEADNERFNRKKFEEACER